MGWTRWLAGLAAASLLGLPLSVEAQVPARIPIQGQLTDAEGAAIDGSVQMRVRLYASETGAGTELFWETQTVSVRQGTFTFMLGDTAPLDISLFADGRPLYVGIAVGDDPEMTPRLPLGSVPYAILAEHAGDASRLQGMAPSDFSSASHQHAFSELTSVPTGLADGDDDTTYEAGDGLSLSGTSFSVDPATVQSRVTGACDPGSSIRAVAADGSVTCEIDDDTIYTDGDAVAAVAAADTYVSNTGDTVAGDVNVDGTLSATRIAGDSIVFRQCGGRYTCTPRECLAACIANDERMAFVDEIYAWASSGRSHCAYVWMLDRDYLDRPVRGFPMYSNRDTGGCGRTGTGDIPRVEGFTPADTWDVTAEYDCACSQLR